MPADRLPVGTSGRPALDIAIAAVGLADKVILSGFSKIKQLRYKGRRDIVTDVDVAAEAAILEVLRREFPTHGFLAEESGSFPGSDDYAWLIDPLDGTTNYSQSIPIFCTSIALSYRGEITMGVINDPMRREKFVAVRGQGARLNGQPIAVSDKTNIAHAAVGVDLSYDEELRKKGMEQAVALLPIVGTLRFIGSAALALAYVAAGRFDFFYDHHLQLWDWAAGSLLVSEAGGKATEWGKPLGHESRAILAGNPTLHDEALRILYP